MPGTSRSRHGMLGQSIITQSPLGNHHEPSNPLSFFFQVYHSQRPTPGRRSNGQISRDHIPGTTTTTTSPTSSSTTFTETRPGRAMIPPSHYNPKIPPSISPINNQLLTRHTYPCPERKYDITKHYP